MNYLLILTAILYIRNSNKEPINNGFEFQDLLGFGFLIYNQRSILYPRQPPVSVKANLLFQMKSSKGIDVALLSNVNRDTKNIIVFFHGNADQLAYGPSFIHNEFAKLFTDYGFISIEYPSYGMSIYPNDYNINMKDINQSSQTLISTIINEKIGHELHNVVFIGQSLGTSIAVYTMKHLNDVFLNAKKKLILISPFTTVIDIIKHSFSKFNYIVDNLPFLVYDNWDTIQYADYISQNVSDCIIIHGDKDTVVPWVLGKTLRDKIGFKCELKTINGAGHNEMLGIYWNHIKDIIKEFINKDNSSNKLKSKKDSIYNNENKSITDKFRELNEKNF